MNPTLKRLVFWGIFLIIIILVIWGMIMASAKTAAISQNGGVTPIAISHSLSADDWTLGSSTASVQLVEYADFQCPACAAYSPVLAQLITAEGSKIYFGYRYFPLPQHANALITAYAATAAGLQGKFWEMHDLLFTHQTDWQDVADPTNILVGYAQSLGLDVKKFSDDLASDAVKARVTEGLNDATAMGLDYTPTLFLDGKRIANPQSYATLKKLVDDAIQSHS